jgi:mRNA interferase YafQ
MNYTIAFSTRFKKDLKKYLRIPDDKKKIYEAIKLLSENGYKAIPVKMKPHTLSGNYTGYWECHVKPDLLLIWKQIEDEKNISLTRVGNHSDLF